MAIAVTTATCQVGGALAPAPFLRKGTQLPARSSWLLSLSLFAHGRSQLITASVAVSEVAFPSGFRQEASGRGEPACPNHEAASL